VGVVVVVLVGVVVVVNEDIELFVAVEEAEVTEDKECVDVETDVEDEASLMEVLESKWRLSALAEANEERDNDVSDAGVGKGASEGSEADKYCDEPNELYVGVGIVRSPIDDDDDDDEDDDAACMFLTISALRDVCDGAGVRDDVVTVVVGNAAVVARGSGKSGGGAL
jgi:hypothetical protein